MDLFSTLFPQVDEDKKSSKKEDQSKPAVDTPSSIISAEPVQVIKPEPVHKPIPSAEEKSKNAYRTISEAATELGVATHVLRFWETKFPQIQPMKRSNGRRYYKPEDVAFLHDIRTLLHDKGFTIKGVQKALKDGTFEQALKGTDKAVSKSDASKEYNPQKVLSELKSIRKLLDA